MLITLTNANPAHKNKPIVLNSDLIVSMHRNIATREDGSIEEVSFVHIPPHGTWEVREELAEILAIASGAAPSVPAEEIKKSKKKV